jgi:hypothetical protein
MNSDRIKTDDRTIKNRHVKTNICSFVRTDNHPYVLTDITTPVLTIIKISDPLFVKTVLRTIVPPNPLLTPQPEPTEPTWRRAV